MVDDTSKAAGNVGMVEMEHGTEFMFKCFFTNFMSHNLNGVVHASPLVLCLVNFTESPPAHKDAQSSARRGVWSTFATPCPASRWQISVVLTLVLEMSQHSHFCKRAESVVPV